MAIEDLPVIKEKDIDETLHIVDKAEICYDALYGRGALDDKGNKDQIFLTDLFYVLGKSKKGGVFVVHPGNCYSKDGLTFSHKLVILDSEIEEKLSRYPFFDELKPIKTYTSLIPASEKK
jgi:hypothetical protein